MSGAGVGSVAAVSAELMWRGEDLVLQLSTLGGHLRQPDAWRRVDEARLPAIEEEFSKCDYHPKVGEVWEAHDWERA